MSDIAGKTAEVFFKLLPQLISWVQGLMQDGVEPEEIEKLFEKQMSQVARNRTKIDDLIDDKFPEEDE